MRQIDLIILRKKYLSLDKRHNLQNETLKIRESCGLVDNKDATIFKCCFNRITDKIFELSDEDEINTGVDTTSVFNAVGPRLIFPLLNSFIKSSRMQVTRIEPKVEQTGDRQLIFIPNADLTELDNMCKMNDWLNSATILLASGQVKFVEDYGIIVYEVN